MFRLISTISSHAFPDFQTRESHKESDALIERILLWILYALIVLFLFCQNSWLLVSVEEEFIGFITGKFMSRWIYQFRILNTTKKSIKKSEPFWRIFKVFADSMVLIFPRTIFNMNKFIFVPKKLFSQSNIWLVIDRGIFKSVIKMSCSVRVFQMGKFFACDMTINLEIVGFPAWSSFQVINVFYNFGDLIAILAIIGWFMAQVRILFWYIWFLNISSLKCSLTHLLRHGEWRKTSILTKFVRSGSKSEVSKSYTATQIFSSDRRAYYCS